MFKVQTPILAMLLDELRTASPELSQLISQVQDPSAIDQRRLLLGTIGNYWHRQGGEPEVLAELGLALAEGSDLEPGVVLADLLMAYGAARDEQQTRQWEADLVRRMAELRGLHRVISAANSTLDLDTSMQTVVEVVAEVMGVEVCSVYLFDKNSYDLTLRATKGLNNAAIGQIRVVIGEGVTGWAAKEGKPVAVPDIRRETRFHREPALAEDEYRAILAVPIVLFSAERFHIDSDKLQGVISIQTRGPRAFTPEEINFVETVAGELAFFVVNAQLYQQTGDQLTQKLRELTTLQQVSKRIAEQLNLEEVLKLIVAKAVDLAHVDRADIFRCDEDDTLELTASYGGNQRNGVLPFIAHAVREGRPLAVLNAYSDSRFPELAQVAADEGFYSLFCMPLNTRGHTIGAICLFTREARHFDYEQVRLLATFADEAAIAIENARLYAESQRALAVKSAMLQEMHHRVRNNLQTISALLMMQMRRISADDKATTAALKDSIGRIQAIAAVHNLLCREDVGITTVEAVAKQIIESAQASLVSPDQPTSFAVIGGGVTIGSRDATVLAIVLNELIANALSHGLAVEGGQVEITTTEDVESTTVVVRDDGPTHAVPVQPSSGSGFGLQIIRTLVIDDLEGSFELREQDGWMNAVVCFPKRMWQE